MKIKIPFYFILFISLNLTAQETIIIPDIGLEECLIDLDIDSNGLNGNILVSDAKYVVNLNIDDPITNKLLPNVHSKIRNLTGLESFPNLKRLDCFGNNITKIDLSKSTSITFLNCSENKIKTLDLSKNNKLVYVSCDSNNLQTLILGDNPNLESVYASYNKLTNLDVSGCPKLETLDASGNKINTIVVSSDKLNTIPEAWYKDEKTVYNTTNSAILKPTVTKVAPIVTPKKAVVIPVKTHSEEFKQQVITAFESEVLNETHLQNIKNKLIKTYNLKPDEIESWLKKYNKRINY
ncbi:leucine-rich repeat domain-containing protein [Tenacibaculum salmonis]|uniref:leucine-rich repeat domain-containing protein n=1 Tax=Tenacibaculum sp. P3-BQ1 TaxID=3232310 RepID=UPI0034DFA5D4